MIQKGKKGVEVAAERRAHDRLLRRLPGRRSGSRSTVITQARAKARRRANPDRRVWRPRVWQRGYPLVSLWVWSACRGARQGKRSGRFAVATANGRPGARDLGGRRATQKRRNRRQDVERGVENARRLKLAEAERRDAGRAHQRRGRKGAASRATALARAIAPRSGAGKPKASRAGARPVRRRDAGRRREEKGWRVLGDPRKGRLNRQAQTSLWPDADRKKAAFGWPIFVLSSMLEVQRTDVNRTKTLRASLRVLGRATGSAGGCRATLALRTTLIVRATF